MKRILLSLIAFAGVFANAFAVLKPIPDWVNNWTSVPAQDVKFYLYNTTQGAGFIKEDMPTVSPFVTEEEACWWVRTDGHVSTTQGGTTYYLSMDSNNAWTNNQDKNDHAFDYSFMYREDSGKFHIEASVVLYQCAFKNTNNVFDADVCKTVISRRTYYDQWYLINETQYNNHMAYKRYHAAATEALSKTSHEASMAWREEHLNLDYQFVTADLSTVDHSKEIDALTEKIVAWNAAPEKYALLNETKAYNSAIPAGEYKAIEVVRTLKASGTWNSFCLPFNLPKSDLGAGAEIKYLGSVDTDGVNYTLNFVDEEGDNLLAGKPYIVKVPAEINVIAKENVYVVDASQTPASETFNGVQFKGNYDQINPPVGTYVISSNKFYSVGSETTVMKGFRGYFIIPVTSGALNASFDNEDVTGITSINGNNNGNDSLYNIAGQRVDGNAKGIIIKNGKKYIVK